jgi:hypothetical protein
VPEAAARATFRERAAAHVVTRITALWTFDDRVGDLIPVYSYERFRRGGSPRIGRDYPAVLTACLESQSSVRSLAERFKIHPPGRVLRVNIANVDEVYRLRHLRVQLRN